MNKNIQNYIENKLQEIKDGKNPITISSEVDGYLDAMEESGTITPIEHVDFLYNFSIDLVEALHPDIKTEKEALEKINSWKIVLDNIASRMM